MEELDYTIVEAAMRLFLRYGVRAVNMDDVARELAISKKTLYKHVSNKEDLVERCCHAQFALVSQAIHSVIQEEHNAIEQLFCFDDAVCSRMNENANPHLVQQLQRYHPKVFAWLEENRRQLVLSMALGNIEQGVKEGLYRHDLDIQLVAHFYYARTQVLNDETLFPPDTFNLQHALHEGLIYHIRGIATEKGLTELENQLNSSNHNL